MLREKKVVAAGLALGAVVFLAAGIGVGLLIAGDGSGSNSSTTGQATKAYLGLTVSFQERNDLRVASVEKDGPAEEAGIEAGDRIRSVNGRVVRTPEQLRTAIESQEPGDLVSITVERGDEELQTQARLGEAPANAQIEAEAQDLPARDNPLADLPEGVERHCSSGSKNCSSAATSHAVKFRGRYRNNPTACRLEPWPNLVPIHSR